jgi:hypothetical protein
MEVPGLQAPVFSSHGDRLRRDPLADADSGARLSDFGFEMRVVQAPRQTGLSDVSHSETYDDPLQNKKRQYDVRASRRIGTHNLLLAVECKNLKLNYPLVIHRSARPQNQSFHYVVTFLQQNSQRCFRIPHPHSVYRAGEMVVSVASSTP